MSFTAVSLSGFVFVYALLNTVVLSDTVSISDNTTPRETAKDTIDLQADAANNNQAALDVLSASEEVSPDTSTIDQLALSDSAEAISSIFHQVSVTSTFAISDASISEASILDRVDIEEKQSLRSLVSEAILLLDSVARAFFIDLVDDLAVSDISDADNEEQSSDEEQDTERRRRQNTDRTVFDKLHFEKYPLDKIQIGSLYLLNDDGSAIQQVRLGDSVDISATIRNFQGMSQPYVFLIQIVDENDFTVEIIVASGIIEDADSLDIGQSWIPLDSGEYSLKIMIWHDISLTPTPLSKSTMKNVAVSE